jgi:tetratricopeptide (TPR) repeat protein
MNLFEKIGDAYGLSVSLENIASCESAAGDFLRAQNRLSRASELHRSMGNRSGEAYVLAERGRIHEALGELRIAADCHQRALAIRRETGERLRQADSLLWLASVSLESGEVDSARIALDEAQVIAQSLPPNNNLLCHLAMGAAALAIEQGDWETAGRELESGLLLVEAIDIKPYRGLLLALRAKLRDKQGDWVGATKDYEECAALFGSLGVKARLAWVCRDFGRALLAHDEGKKGRWYLAEARRLWEGIGAKGWLEKMDSEGL